MATRRGKASKPTAAQLRDRLQARIDQYGYDEGDRERATRSLLDSDTQRAAIQTSTPTALDSIREDEEESSWFGDGLEVAGAAVDAVQGSFQRMGAGAVRSVSEQLDEGNLARTGIQYAATLANTIMNPEAPRAGESGTDYLMRSMGLFTGDSLETESTRAADSLRAAATSNEANVEKARKIGESRGWLADQVTETALDVAGSGTSALSIFGGPLAAVGIADAYAQSYDRARTKGLSEEDSTTMAIASAAPELMSLIPAERVLEKIPGLSAISDKAKDKIASVATRAMARGASVAVAEGINETATGAMEMNLQHLIANAAESEELRKYAREQLPTSSGQAAVDLFRQFKAGAVMGGGVGTVQGGLQAAAEAGQLAADFQREMEVALSQETNNQTLDANDAFRASQQREIDRVNESMRGTQLDMFEGGSDGFATYTPEQADTLREEAALRQQQVRRNSEEMLAAEAATKADQEAESWRQQDILNTAAAAPDNAMAAAFANASIGRIAPEVTPEVAVAEEVAQAAEPVQTEMFGTLDTRTTDQQSIDAEAAKIEKQLATAEKKELNTLKAKRAADRRAEVARLLTVNSGLPNADRAKVVATEMVQWDRANPVPTSVPVSTAPAPTPAPVATPAPAPAVAPAPVQEGALNQIDTSEMPVEEAVLVEQEALDSEQDMSEEDAEAAFWAAVGGKDGNAPVASIPAVERNSPAAQALKAVRDNVVVKIGKGRSENSIAQLVSSGKLRFIASDRDIPANADARGSGWYTGNEVVVDARKLDQDNIVGDLMDLMAHEYKHAADVSGVAKRGSLAAFIGTEANTNLITKIRNAANNGDAAAKRAISRAEAGSADANALSLEIPAYYISEARAKPTSLYRGMVSAVRTGAKGVLGVKDVNLDDVHYLSDKLVSEIARGDDSIAGDISNPVAMVASENARGFEQARANGQTFRSPDGREKFVFSDAGMKVKSGARKRMSTYGDYEGELLKDLVSHPELQSNYPELYDTLSVVVSDTGMDGQYGQYLPEDNAISISREALNLSDKRFREVVAHEVQHAVQNAEGYSDQFFNASPSAKAETSRVEFEAAEQTVNNLSDQVLKSYNRFASQVPGLRDSTQTMMNDDSVGSLEAARAITKAAQGKEIPPALRALANRFDEADDAFVISADTYQKSLNEDFGNYAANITESEALYTEANVDTAQEDLSTDPTQDMRDLNSEFTGGRIDVTDGEGNVQPMGKAPLASIPKTKEEIAEVAKARNDGLKNHGNKQLNAVHGLINYTGGLGKKVDDKLQDSIGEAAWYAEHGRSNMTNLTHGIEAMAARKGRSIDSVNKEVGIVMQAIAKVPRAEARQRILSEYVAQNPEMRPLAKAYSDIAAATNLIADQAIGSKINPTKADLEFAQKLRDSAWGYVTQIYSAHQGTDGRVLARKMLSDVAKVKKLAAAGKTSKITESMRERAVVYADGLRVVTDMVTIPTDKQDMYKMSDSSLNALWDTWMDTNAVKKRMDLRSDGKARGMDDKESKRAATAAMVNALHSKAADVTAADVTAKAEASIREMLGLSNKGAIASRTAALTQDRGILKKREDLPVELQRLLGKVEDPATLLGATLAKQGELIARTKFLMNLRDSGLAVTQDLANTPGYESFTEAIKGESAGPLSNMYTTPRVANVINSDVFQQFDALDTMARSWLDTENQAVQLAAKGIKGVKWTAQTAKSMSIVFDAFNMTLNAAGSPLMLAMNGVTNFKTALDGAKAGMSSVADQFFDGKGSINPDLEEAIRYNVTDSARAQELRQAASKYIKNKIKDTPRSDEKYKAAAVTTGRASMEKLIKLKVTTAEMFAMSDAWVKIAAFKDRTAKLKDFYKAEGISKTDEEIKSEAAATVRQTNITYGKVPPVLKLAESVGLTTFMGYFYNVPRSIAYSTMQGYEDIRTGLNATSDEGKNIMLKSGISRLTGAASATAGVIAVTTAMAAAMNDGEDEDKIEDYKKGLRDDARVGNPVYIGKDKNGTPLFFRLGRIDPMGPVNDAVRTALDDSLSTDQKQDLLEGYVKELFFMNRGVATLGKAMFGDDTMADSRLERILGKEVSYESAKVLGLGNDAAGIGALRVVDSMLPGQTDMLDPKNLTAEKDLNGGIAEVLSALTWTLGGRLDKADPGAIMKSMSFESEEIKKRYRNSIGRAFMADADAEQIVKLVTDASESMYERTTFMADAYQSAVAVTGSERQAREMLKTYGKLDARQIALISRGLPDSDPSKELVIELGQVLSKKSVHGLADRQADREKAPGGKMSKEQKKQYDDLLRTLRTVHGIKSGD